MGGQKGQSLFDKDHVGLALRVARLQQERSLTELASMLAVPEDVLADLEAGRTGAFEQDLHVRAHVEMYARALGLDPRELLPPADVEGSQEAPEPPSGRPSVLLVVSLVAAGAMLTLLAVVLVTFTIG